MIERGILLRDLNKLWRERGHVVEVVRRTGEARYLDTGTGQRSSKFSRRRKDAPVRLLTFVRRVLARGKAL